MSARFYQSWKIDGGYVVLQVTTTQGIPADVWPAQLLAAGMACETLAVILGHDPEAGQQQ